MFKKFALCAVALLLVLWSGEWKFIQQTEHTASAAVSQECEWRWREFEKPQPRKARGGSFLHDITFVNDQELWAAGYFVGKTARPLLMHNDSMRWRIEPTLPIQGVLYGVSAVDAEHVWAVGTEYVPFVGDTPLILQRDSTQWQKVSHALSVSGEFYDVAASTPNNVWAVGYQPSSEYLLQAPLIAHWDGTQWQVMLTPKDEWWSYYLYSIAIIDSNDIWAGGWKTDFDSNSTALYHWDGSAWSEVHVPYGWRINSISALASNDVWAVGSGGFVLHWNGITWEQVETPFNGWLASVSAISKDSIWVAGSTTRKGFIAGFIAHWNGAQWTREWIGSSKSIYHAIGVSNSHHVHVVGEKSGKVLRVKGVCRPMEQKE